MKQSHNINLLVGLDTSDDAAVYRLNEDQALIQTLDFFTPVVDDPYTFGQIAAANALSDVYAMGGEPFLALNIVCFPDCLDPAILAEILRGGQDKVIEAGAVLAGGHSISDEEPKYGLAVAGLVHPSKIMTNAQARPGDLLVLTKPLGVGIVNTALKADMASEQAVEEAILSMITLNKIGKTAADQAGSVHSITDITGFGLLGHAVEMAQGSQVTLRLIASQIPVIEAAREYASFGLIPAGAYKNRDYFGPHIQLSEALPKSMEDILFDPQTSGGLLISVAPERAPILLEALESSPVAFGLVGEVLPLQEHSVVVE